MSPVALSVQHLGSDTMAGLTEKKALDVPSEENLKSASRTASSEANEHQGINEKALLRKLDIRLLPPLTILYLLSFLDRSNGMCVLCGGEWVYWNTDYV